MEWGEWQLFIILRAKTIAFMIEQEELNAGKEEINWDHYKNSIKEIRKMK